MVLRVIGLVLLAGIVIPGAAHAIAAFFRQTATVASTLPASVHEVVITDDAGDVRVRTATATGTGAATATGTGAGTGTGAPGQLVRRESWAFIRPEVTTSVSGDVLTISTRCPARWSLVAGPFCRVHLDLTVAPTTRIVVGTRTGDVEVRGMRAEVQATTKIGDVILDAVASTNVHARSGTGNITLTKVESPTVQAATGTGDIVMAKLTCTDLQAQTSTGDIRLGLAAPPEVLRAHTKTGDVQVRVPHDGTVYRVRATTSVGTTRLQVPTASEASHQLDLVTSVGDITVGLKQS